MKKILIDHKKCTGCRQCETACSAAHYEGEVNPQKSRIRIFLDEENSVFHPVISGPFANAECTSRNVISIEGVQYDECTVCRASCPSRPWFFEPETNIALKCDFCGDPPDPQCVAICAHGALMLVDEPGIEAVCKRKEKTV
jgi:Fe-S-cluster-containing hydrogenase component 2